jgi:serine/threonine-protein kinase
MWYPELAYISAASGVAGLHLVPPAPSLLETTLDLETQDSGGLQPWLAAPPAAPEAAPARIGRHAVVRELGRGRTGVVYEALDPDRGRVAIKVLSTGPAATAALEARFLFEACTLLRLAHPTIVRAYEIGRHEGGLFFVMDCIEGPTLAQRLRSAPPDLAASLRIVAAVARGVHHVHEQGLVHRDLKPGNIVLERGVEPRIIDFGIAMAIDDPVARGDGRILGTPGYMAPEQAEGRNQAIGPAADVHALGAIVHQVITGRAPFGRAGTGGARRAVQVSEPPGTAALAPGVLGALEQICQRAMARDPADRHGSALELARAIERCLHREVRQAARARRATGAGDR